MLTITESEINNYSNYGIKEGTIYIEVPKKQNLNYLLSQGMYTCRTEDFIRKAFNLAMEL